MIEFREFYLRLHGHLPFPWQERLALALADHRTPQVTVPTGMGKSAALDAALWAAMTTGWRRLVFIVDRRLVVVEVYQRALRIQQALKSNQHLRECSQALGELQVVRLRGGVFGDDEWVLYPERLSIVLSTVDQVGSRLLNRGYGVSPRRWPLHAGFFGSRSLMIVDEAHLSAPFVRTLDRIRELGADLRVIPMSATPGQSQSDEIALDDDDFANSLIERRFSARKSARLVEITERDLVKQALSSALELGAGQLGKTVAVVVNRVATARAIHDQLARIGLDTVLVIGRCRPVDRDAVLSDRLPLLRSGRKRGKDEASLCVVATQTIEVGADFDFDALVTECASLSALRQRFGRLDRLGELGECSAHVLIRQEKGTENGAEKHRDPVYGEAATRAAQWLQAASVEGCVDFGLAGFAGAAERLEPPQAENPFAATLLPTHLDLLAQSGPYAPELDVAAWLHGQQPKPVDISVVWRADLPSLPTEGLSDELSADWTARVAAQPPSRAESLEIPLTTFRNWLRGRKDSLLSDLGSGSPAGKPQPDDAEPYVLRWRGPEESELVRPAQLRPGDTVILPASVGGCDRFGWAPDSKEGVADHAEAARLHALAGGARGVFTLRLWSGRCDFVACDQRPQLDLLIAGYLAAWKALQRPDGDDEAVQRFQSAQDALRDWLKQCAHAWTQALGSDFILEPYPAGVLARGRGIQEERGIIETGTAVELRLHHEDVGRWVGNLANGHEDSDRLVGAAIVHDEGKRDPRMQLMLHGDALRAECGPVLAKSGLASGRDRYVAWRDSGLPRGFRHELASLVYAPQEDALISHLVGTHHGYGRPWFVPCADVTAAGAHLASLGSPWLAQFAQMHACHGLWGLAEREWLLRAADARASIEEAAGVRS